MIGREVGGRYTLVQEIGRGATAIVFRARDKYLRTDVAIKLLAPHLVTDPAALGRMRREALAARQVASEAVAQVHDLACENGRYYLVMEYCPTGTLRDHLLLQGSLSPELLDRLLEQLADALAACHRRGILHRDIKPSNILFEPHSGRAKLIDFGVARVADVLDIEGGGSLVGTPEYMAPEQFFDPLPDPRSDLYSLGVVLFEAATGRPPIAGRSVPELVRKHAEGVRLSPRRLNASIAPGMEGIILKLLRPDPSDRFQSAEELRCVVEGKVTPEPETERRRPVCPECGAARESDLAFCPMCARSLETFDAFGRWSVELAPPWDEQALSRVLDVSLPEQAVRRARRAQWASGRDRLNVVMFASEPLARWLAARLRRAGFDASTNRLTIGRAFFAVVGFTFVSFSLPGTVSIWSTVLTRPWYLTEAVLWPVTLALLSGGVTLWATLYLLFALRAIVSRSLAYITPLPRALEPIGAIGRARLAQAALMSGRCRTMGCQLLLSAHRLAGPQVALDPRKEAILDEAYRLLMAIDQQVLTWRSIREPAEAKARRQDVLVRGIHLLLLVIAAWRSEYAARVRAASLRLKGALGRLAGGVDAVTGATQELREVLHELEALPTAPKPGVS